MQTIKLKISGMTCAVCSARVEKALISSGAQSADISVTGGFALVIYDEDKTSVEKMIRFVKKAGYGCEYYEKRKEKKTFPIKPVLSAAFTLVIMYFSMGGMIGLPIPDANIASLIEAFFALIVIILNFSYFKVGFKNLIKLFPTMDSLIAIGSTSAFLYSVYGTVRIFSGSEANLYFESAAMILTFVSIGKTLEARSKAKTLSALDSLSKLMPDEAISVRDGKEILIKASEIINGDRIIVRSGGIIPADGRVISGSAWVDESALTGESDYSEKEEGSKVFSSSAVMSGYIEFIAEKAGKETLFSKLVEMVENASASKAPVQKLADRISRVFVPAVILISAVTFVIWLIVTGSVEQALLYGVSVLVVSCPCALGLATPCAISASVGRGATMGIFIKNASVLESASFVDTIVFDKTGTLTEGKPELVKTYSFGIDENKAISIASSIEKSSSHPFSQALCSLAGEAYEADGFKEYPGRGVSGIVDSVKYYCGNKKLMLFASEDTLFPEIEASSGTVLYLSEYSDEKAENRIISAFLFKDRIKESSKSAVSSLQSMGKEVIMLTGDSEKTALEVSEELGISRTIAEVMPDSKEKEIEKLKSENRKIMMVGDGVNDSPALALSDVSAAMGSGRESAIDSSDVIIFSNSPEDIPALVSLAKKTYRIIRENLFWALFYNCIFIPVASGAFSFAGIRMHPMYASLAMSLSSLFVVSNALRLSRFTYKKSVLKEYEEMENFSYELKIEGMMCSHCSMHCKEALEGIKNVISAEVSHESASANVKAKKEIPEDAFKKAIEKAGYTLLSVTKN